MTGGVLPLRYAEDWRSLLFLGTLAGLLAVQWTGLVRHWLMLVPTCALAFVACVIKHNHIHCQTFTGRGWNAAFGHVLGLLTGHPTTAIITAHNVRHHRENQTPRDWVRCSLVGFRWNWLNLLCFPFVAVVRMRRDKPSDLADWRTRAPRVYRQALAERVVLYPTIVTFALLDWRSTLVYLAAPWLFAQWSIIAINLLQHQDCDPRSAHDHSRNVTGRLVNWFVLNNGFHSAHHARPGLHWSRLPAYHRASILPHMRPDLEERSLLAATWRRFFAGGGSRAAGAR